MSVSTQDIKNLREQTGAGIMDCKNALQLCDGNIEEAIKHIKSKGLEIVQKKSSREASEGLIGSYIHVGNQIGSLVQIGCETDFVARTDEVKELSHNIAMQVAAMNAEFISKSDIPKSEEDSSKICLLEQQYIKDPSITIQDLLNDVIAKVGENIQVTKIVRFALGE